MGIDRSEFMDQAQMLMDFANEHTEIHQGTAGIAGQLAVISTALLDAVDRMLGGIGLFLIVATANDNELGIALSELVRLAAVLGYLSAKGIEIPDAMMASMELEAAMWEALRGPSTESE